MHKIDLLKPKVTLLQKITLIAIGVLLCMFPVEIGLRTGGFLVISIQEHRNRLAMKKKGAYRIMCLGESTTAGQYPPFLEEILNKRNAGLKFSVIDKGVSGTNTTAMLSQLESNLNEYKPDMVLTMIGINDFGPHLPYEAASTSNIVLFIRTFRTYKLIRLMWLHIVTKTKELGFYYPKEDSTQQINPNQIAESLKEANTLNLPDDQAYEARGHFYQGQDKFLEAAEFYNKAIQLNPRNDGAYAGLGWCYLSQAMLSRAIGFFSKAIQLNPGNDGAYCGLGSFYLTQCIYAKAEEFYNKAIQLNPGNDSAYAGLGWCYRSQGKFSRSVEPFKKAIGLNAKNHWGLIGLASSYQYLQEFSEAIELFNKAIELKPKDVKGYIGLGTCYLKQKEYSQAEGVFKKAIDACPGYSEPYGLLSILYKEMGQYETAEGYHRRANAVRLEYYEPMTVNNYRKIKSILDMRGIRLVCVEYPMRSIESLKKIFKEENGIIFVDNETIFKNALFENGYSEYFIDMFGGDFGHCTKKGNTLLAGNIVNVILKEIFGK